MAKPPVVFRKSVLIVSTDEDEFNRWVTGRPGAWGRPAITIATCTGRGGVGGGYTGGACSPARPDAGGDPPQIHEVTPPPTDPSLNFSPRPPPPRRGPFRCCAAAHTAVKQSGAMCFDHADFGAFSLITMSLQPRPVLSLLAVLILVVVVVVVVVAAAAAAAVRCTVRRWLHRVCTHARARSQRTLARTAFARTLTERGSAHP